MATLKDLNQEIEELSRLTRDLKLSEIKFKTRISYLMIAVCDITIIISTFLFLESFIDLLPYILYLYTNAFGMFLFIESLETCKFEKVDLLLGAL